MPPPPDPWSRLGLLAFAIAFNALAWAAFWAAATHPTPWFR